LCFSAAQAQVIFDAEDMSPPIGLEQENELIIFPGIPWDLDVGLPGEMQEFDLTQISLDVDPVTLTTKIVRVEDTPYGLAFPQADYAIQIEDSYLFMRRAPSGDEAVGTGGEGLPQASPNYSFPLSVGKRWEYKEKLDFAMPATGYHIFNDFDLQVEVDASGFVTLEAGRFECLRVHRQGKGSQIYKAISNLEELLTFGVEVDRYDWIVKGTETVAYIEYAFFKEEGTGETFEVTTILRAKSVKFPPTAISTTAWGDIKERFGW